MDNKKIDLTLSVIRPERRKFSVSAKIEKQILKKNSIPINTGNKMIKVPICQSCGLPVGEGTHMIEPSEKPTESLLLCKPCYYPRNLDELTMPSNGYIILEPRIDQTEINTLICALWYSQKIYDDDELLGVIEQLTKSLSQKKTHADLYIAKDISNIEYLTQVLYQMDSDDYERRYNLLKHLRWMPSIESILPTMEYWRRNCFGLYSPKNWYSLINSIGKEREKKF
ncbi:hypothetical protein [Photobacterium leiognathi]|uniref:hypothetical protein n=1 Tax=Photobacterium leiognathi TaxID=553611 RepID=UPI0029825809|nr:hypothetical protein [Photobacterium leiognathi]